MRNASYLAMRYKNDFTKLTMRSMHRKLLDNYAEHVARYDDRYSRLRMRRVNLSYVNAYKMALMLLADHEGVTVVHEGESPTWATCTACT